MAVSKEEIIRILTDAVAVAAEDFEKEMDAHINRDPDEEFVFTLAVTPDKPETLRLFSRKAKGQPLATNTANFSWKAVSGVTKLLRDKYVESGWSVAIHDEKKIFRVQSLYPNT